MRKLRHLTRINKAILGTIQKSLDDFLFYLYCSPLAWLRGSPLSAAVYLRRLFLFLRRGLVMQVYQLEGNLVETGEPVRVIYFAEGKGFEYIQTLLFGEGKVVQSSLGQCSAFRAGAAAQAVASQCDLVVMERNTLLKWKPAYGTWVKGPTWVRMVFDLPREKTWQEVTRLFKSHEMNVKRMKRAGFTYEISRNPQDFDLFYSRMHLPLIQGRHGGYGIVDTRENMFKYFQRGFLMFICNSAGERVAGDLNTLRGDVFLGLANGVLDGDQTWLDQGALSALYYFSLQWCHENGIRRQDIGEVRPFVNNGLFQYKRRWGFTPIQEIWNTREWLFWVPDGSQPALDWLNAHPFLPEFCQAGDGGLRKTKIQRSQPVESGKPGRVTL